jgi:beta-1,4-N-acetylglucosaminyltransferase
LKPGQLAGAYFLVVLGSGGHTKEMFAMMEINFPAAPGLHRRYVVSSGDSMSLKHLKAFEESLTTTYGEEKAGSYDVHIVTRARKIHQPLYTVPLSGLQSILDIFPLLLRSPFSGIRSRQKYPDVILTNGPATGLFVGLAAWALRIFHIVPEEAAQILYVESWARIKTLSLTGLLFHRLGIADVFLVQHEKVAQKYGLQNAGCIVVKQQQR